MYIFWIEFVAFELLRTFWLIYIPIFFSFVRSLLFMRSSNVVHLTSVVGFLVRSFAHSIVCSLVRFFFFFSRFDGSLVCFRLCVGIFSSKLDCDCKYECVLCVSVWVCVCLWLSRSLSPRVCDMENMCVHISIYIGVWWPSFVCDDSYTMPLVYQHLKI